MKQINNIYNAKTVICFQMFSKLPEFKDNFKNQKELT